MAVRLSIAVAATVLLLAGCATQPRVAAISVDPAARRALLEAQPKWEARGRIAVKAPNASGQGSFTWQQDGDSSVIRVSGPFGAGGYEIHWDPARLIVTTSRGAVAADYTGPEAAQRFLDGQLGWSLPVADARRWLLGLSGSGSTGMETVGADGLLAGLVQGDWRVDFSDYLPSTIPPATTVYLPRKLTAESPDARIRLVIDDWRF